MSPSPDTRPVFVSYASANREVVYPLTNDLVARGVQFWIDKDGLKPGMPDWERGIRDALRQCSVLLYMVSPESLESRAVRGELAIAEMLGIPVLAIWIKGDRWPDSAKIEYISAQRIDARPANYAAALALIVESIDREQSKSGTIGNTVAVSPPVSKLDPVSPFTFTPRNPYKGLKAFDESDKGDFFGRSELTAELVSDVNGMTDTRFLAVIGPSGSGKSSVVRAGLIPKLREPNPEWVFLPPMTPGASPLKALTSTVSKQSSKSNTAIREDLDARAGDGLDMLARNIVNTANGRVVLFIDQFEELFTQTASEPERQQFINLLTTAATERNGVLIVILTMRADFYDRPLNYESLAKLIEGHQRTIPPLSLIDLKDAILKPAALPDVQLTFEEGLPADLVFEVRDRAGALPLLQFALDQLFERCKDNPDRRLTYAAYKAVGGVSGALQVHADALYKGLPTDSHRDLAKALFLKLIELGATEQDTTRRRVLDRELELADDLQSTVLNEVIAAFVNGRLLTADQDALEVSHEALIREWMLLKDWIAENRGDVLFGKQVTQAADEWTPSGSRADDDGLLFRSTRLINAQQWAARNMVSKNVAAFVAASAARETYLKGEDVRRLKELAAAKSAADTATNRAKRQRRETIRALVVAVIGFIGLAIFALIGVKNAQTEVANANATLTPVLVAIATSEAYSQSLSFAAKAEAIIQNTNSGKIPAALLAIRGLKLAYSDQTYAALVKALNVNKEIIALIGHTESVTDAAFSPNGQLIITASKDRKVHVWDAHNGNLLHVLFGHRGLINSIEYSPDGQNILAVSQNEIYIWNNATGVLPKVIGTHTDNLNSAAFSPDGRFIVTASNDKTAIIWDTSKGTVLRVMSGHTSSVTGAWYSPDGRLIVTISADKTARVWNAENGETLRILEGHSNLISGAAFSPDQRYVVTSSWDKTARVWDVSGGVMLRVLTGHTNAVRSVAYSPDGQIIATSSDDNTVYEWDAKTGAVLAILPSHSDAVRKIAFSPDGNYIVSASQDKTAIVWSVANKAQPRLLSLHSEALKSAAFSPDGRYIVTASNDNTARVWDRDTYSQIRLLVGHTAAVTSAQFSYDGRHIVTSSADKTVRVWDVGTGTTLLTLSGHTNTVNCASFSRDGKFIVSASADSSIRIWNASTGTLVRTLNGPLNSVYNAQFSPDGRTIVSSSDENKARLWNVSDGALILTFSGHNNAVTDAEFNPDGRTIVTSSYDKTVRIWNVTNGSLVRIFRGHSDAVYSASFSPDGQLIVSASADNSARIWRVEDGQILGALAGHLNWVSTAAFSPDGNQIVTASYDKTARIWDSDYHKFILYACSRLWHDLSGSERILYGIKDEDPTCPKFDTSKGTFTLYPTPTNARDTWTPFPVPDTPEPIFIPSYTPGSPPTRIELTATLTPRATKSPTATATIIIQPYPTRTVPVWTPIASPTPSDTPTP